MSERDQFVAQPRNNALRASIKLGRNGLSQRGYLRDLHAIILSGNSIGLAGYIAKPRFLRRHRTGPAAATLAAMQRETDRGRRRKREVLIPRSACSWPQGSEVPLPMRGWDCSVSSFE